MTTSETLLEELAWRGLLYQQTEGLGVHFAKGTVTAYCGYDPTAPSLHIGNLVPTMLLVHIARAGHRAIALVGGGTAMIGDPSGKSEERPLAGGEAINANAAKIHAQLSRLFESANTAGVALANNADWLLKIGAVDFMRDVGKHFSVNYMLAKDSVQSRIETGISYTRILLFVAAGVRLSAAVQECEVARCKSAAATSGATSPREWNSCAVRLAARRTCSPRR